MARENNILTVGVVTKPFQFEGAHRMKTAEAGIQELQQYVDTLIIIPNQNLFRIANAKTTFADAFKMADEVLHSGVRGVTDLIVMPGLINLDFADIRTVMSEMGKAMMGTGEAAGEERASRAADSAISNPLLDEVSLKGARSMLINITAGMDLSLHEVDEVVNRVRAEVDPDANVIFGSTFDQAMEGRLRVSVVATGMDAPASAQRPPLLEVIRGGVSGNKQIAAPEPAEPMTLAEMPQLADAVPAAPMSDIPPPRPPIAPERRVSIDAGVYIPASAPPAPEPKRSFTLFERLTGAARREQKDDN
jgi:cell division protein FtsZ